MTADRHRAVRSWRRQPTTYRYADSDFAAWIEATGRHCFEWSVYRQPVLHGVPGWHGEARTLRAAKKAAAAKIEALAAFGAEVRVP